MTRQELRIKLESGGALTPMESALLETYLAEDSEAGAALALRDLPAPSPSLAWRSQLNERIATRASRRSAFRLRWGLPILGTASVAATALVALYAWKPTQPEVEPNITSYLFEWHEEAAAAVILPDGGTDLEGFLRKPRTPHSDEIDELLYGRSIIDTL